MKLHFSPLTKVRISFYLNIVTYTLAKTWFFKVQAQVQIHLKKCLGYSKKAGVSQRKVAGKQKV